jgi:hypothetical protein
VYVNAPVPPVALELRIPLHCPKQVTFVSVGAITIAGGFAKLTVAVFAQPNASATVTV